MKEAFNLKLLYLIIPLFIFFFAGIVSSASISYNPLVSQANPTPEISSSKMSRAPIILPSIQRNYGGVLLPPEVTNAKAYFKNVTPKNTDDSYSSVENTWATCSSQGYKKIPVFLVEFSDYPHLSNLTVSDINPPGPGPGNDYSFCSVSALSGGSDTLRVCLNDYTTTLNLGNSDYLKVYVNQPDALENNCQSTLKGNKVCVYVGNSWR